MPISFRQALRYSRFLRDFFVFRRLSRAQNGYCVPTWSERYPCLLDNTQTTNFDRHYVYHPAWAARIVAKTRPALHIDISSTLHFCTLLSAFVPVHFFDYRPADIRLENLSAGHADLLALPFKDKSIDSLSCMHVVEHIGLGRYGEPLDPDSDRKAMAELVRVLAPGGTLLFVVPVGRPAIQFNAHRIYDPDDIIKRFSELTLNEFTLIPEDAIDGGLVRNPARSLVEKQRYGCGCFWFTRA